MKTLRYFAMLAVLLATAACTHNNGDIGPWFGTWHIDYVGYDPTASSPIAPNADEQYFLQFQGDIVSLRVVNTVTHAEDAAYGTWSEGDNSLEITFPYADVAYTYLLGMSRERTNHFLIRERKGNEMTLELANEIDDVLPQNLYYHIKKLY